MAKKTDWLKRLAASVGASNVVADPESIRAHSGDKWFATGKPDAVVYARTTAEISAVLRIADEARIPVTPRGAGTGYVGGCVPVRGGIALSVAKMDRMIEIDRRDGVAVVEPGVITGRLQAECAKRGLMYPPDPASLSESSIGGNIATNAGGPRCLKYGVTRAYVLGLDVVLPGGNVLCAGGRTHKNKTGFDLIGPFVGSEGMLGVVARATLRLLPRPPARAALSAVFPKFADAAKAVQRILGSGFLPSVLEIADRFTLEAARAHLGKSAVPAGEGHLLVECDGQPGSVRLEGRAIGSLLKTLGARPVRLVFGDGDCAALWELRRKFSESLRATGLVKLNEDIVVPRGRLTDLVGFCRRLSARHGFPVACFGHAGDGNIHVNVMAKDYGIDRAVTEKVGVALDELFVEVLALGGAITGEHGVGIAKGRWWDAATDPVIRKVHADLKRALDPNGIMNPGKFLG
jgi:glycolate oxidase subunit GlcD